MTFDEWWDNEFIWKGLSPKMAAYLKTVARLAWTAAMEERIKIPPNRVKSNK